MAAHLDEQRHVLVEDRAQLHAGRSRWCRPRSSAGFTSAPRIGPPPSRTDSFKWCISILGDSAAARGYAGAGAVAAAALGAGQAVEQLPPGEVLAQRRAVGRRRQPVAVQRGREHAERRGQQVQVLRVRQVGQEPEHRQHVRPPHRHVHRRAFRQRAGQGGPQYHGNQKQDEARVARLLQARRRKQVAPGRRYGQRRQTGHARKSEAAAGPSALRRRRESAARGKEPATRFQPKVAA